MRNAFFLSLLILLLAAGSACATEIRAEGQNVIIGSDEVVNDDLIVFGQKIEINGTVNGDLIAFGSNVSVNGEVRGSVMAAAETVAINNKVEGSVRAAGRYVTITGEVGRNLAAAGKTVVLAKSARVGKDLHIAGESLDLAGDVGRMATLAGSNITISGKVAEDVQADVQNLSIDPGAVIGGDLNYRSPEQLGAPPSGVVHGIIHYLPPLPKKQGGGWVWPILMTIGSFLLGVITIAIAPRYMASAANAVSQPFWKSLLYGFVILIVVPIAAIIICFTVVGIPLGITLLMTYIGALLLCSVPVAISVGRWLLQRMQSKAAISLYLALLTGLIILFLLMKIPIAGGLLRFAVILTGLGALARTLRGVLAGGSAHAQTP